jgi:hypothetical protein
MESTFIIGLILFISGLGITIFLTLGMTKRKQDENLSSFYNACNDLRDAVHSSNSRAEALVLMDEIVYVRETYESLVPSVVLDKELKLLSTLLNKKSKKLK